MNLEYTRNEIYDTYQIEMPGEPQERYYLKSRNPKAIGIIETLENFSLYHLALCQLLEANKKQSEEDRKMWIEIAREKFNKIDEIRDETGITLSFG